MSMSHSTFTASFFSRLLGVCLLALGVAAPPLFRAEAHTLAGPEAREAAFSTTATRIMPLGNSITQAHAGRNSYRAPCGTG
jgi:hypothetical protein